MTSAAGMPAPRCAAGVAGWKGRARGRSWGLFGIEGALQAPGERRERRRLPGRAGTGGFRRTDRRGVAGRCHELRDGGLPGPVQRRPGSRRSGRRAGRRRVRPDVCRQPVPRRPHGRLARTSDHATARSRDVVARQPAGPPQVVREPPRHRPHRPARAGSRRIDHRSWRAPASPCRWHAHPKEIPALSRSARAIGATGMAARSGGHRRSSATGAGHVTPPSPGSARPARWRRRGPRPPSRPAAAAGTAAWSDTTDCRGDRRASASRPPFAA